MIIKKACDRGNITEDECLHILSEMKNIKKNILLQIMKMLRNFLLK